MQKPNFGKAKVNNIDTKLIFNKSFSLYCHMQNIFVDQFTQLESVSACLSLRDSLSSSGEFAKIKELLKTATAEEKKNLGSQLNELRVLLQEACDGKILSLQEIQEKDDFLNFDPSFYSFKYQDFQGKLHPVTLVMNEIVEKFVAMGFDVADGPLVETQWYNFTSLNQPSYHPARAMQDTFYLDIKDSAGEDYLLRTQTSSVQMRYGETHQPPFSIVVPGQVYRNENIDATHDIMFHQMECLVVANKISVAQLKTVLENLFSQVFDDELLKVRFRPSYFPYTIPSMEYDITCPFCHNEGCRICKHTGWIELGGAGLVHPDVIANMGHDPQKWQGFAFGFGVDRVTQFKLDISGMSQLFNGNIKFLAGK